MRSILVSAAAVVLLSPSVCRADDKAEWKKLLGTWKLTLAIERGEKMKDVKNGSLEIEKDKFTITFEKKGIKKSEPTGVKIDFSKSPIQIDFVKSDKLKALGIMKLDSKKLTLCFVDVDQERPTKFESKKGSRNTLTVFERAKKK